MAEVKYVKIPSDFFSREPISLICNKPNHESTVLLYIHLLCESHKKRGNNEFSVVQMTLTDEVLSSIFRCDNIGERIAVLESYGLIKRSEKSIEVIKFWIDPHDRNSANYRNWRKKVFDRDEYRCKKCGTRKNLQAHHIKTWMQNKALRYEVSNGITLCRDCHLAAHGGSWRNGQ